MCENGSISKDQKVILNEQVKFYKKLYTSDKDVKFTLTPEPNERMLSNGERELCEKEFSTDEYYDAVMTLKSNKVPGLDGLTVEFYQRFWKKVSGPLIQMYQYTLEMGRITWFCVKRIDIIASKKE